MCQLSLNFVSCNGGWEIADRSGCAVCGRSLAGIAGSNLARSIAVFVVIVVCCLVEVWSLLQRSATECGVSGADREAAHASVVYVYSSRTACLSIRLEYNFRFVGLGGWGVRGSEQKKK